MKREFQFLMPDGSTETNTDTDYLKKLGMTADFIRQRQKQEEAHFISEMYNERRWRNRQLRDALYLKQLGVVSVPIIDNYIADLKAYDLKYQPRPVFPQLTQEAENNWQDWL